jgi:phage terminase small subunit
MPPKTTHSSPSTKPPSTLSKPAQALWNRVQDEYALEDVSSLTLLAVALQAWDRLEDAKRILAKGGLVIPGATAGTFVQHPALRLERDSRAAFLTAWKSLNLDVEPLKEPGGQPRY